MEQYEALEALLGDEPADKPAQEPADIPAAEDESDDDALNGSEAAENTDESDDEDSEETTEESDEDAETTSKVPLSEVTKLRHQKREISEKYEAYQAEMQSLLDDPDFLKHRLTMVNKAREVDPNATVSVEIPTAPAYPNTPRGVQRMQREQVEATELLGQHAENDAVVETIEGLVLKGKTYLEATRDVQKLFGLEAAKYKQEGKRETEEVLAKKTRMNDATKSRSVPRTDKDRLRSDLKSKSETVRMTAGVELLGL